MNPFKFIKNLWLDFADVIRETNRYESQFKEIGKALGLKGERARLVKEALARRAKLSPNDREQEKDDRHLEAIDKVLRSSFSQDKKDKMIEQLESIRKGRVDK